MAAEPAHGAGRRKRPRCRRPPPFAAPRPAVHHAARYSARLVPSARLGHTLGELERRHKAQPQRFWPHRLYRHVSLDRPGARSFHYSVDQPREPDARQYSNSQGPPPTRGPRGRCPQRRSGVPMTLSAADWIIIALYFAASIAIGLYFTERA